MTGLSAVVVALVLAVPAACPTARAGPGMAAGSAVQTDYGVKLVGPVDSTGSRPLRSVTAGRPFYVRVQLFTDGTGPASVTYDVDLPTGMDVVPARLRGGAVTSSCLRACTVGWNATRSRQLSVYYALVPPGPGAFVVEASIVSTNRIDAHERDNTATATIVVVSPRLSFGRPVLESGPPVAGRDFGVTVPVRRGGTPVRPLRATCAAAAGSHVLAGVVMLRRGNIRCTWHIPSGAGRMTLRTHISATAGALRAAGSWLYAIRAR